MAEDLGAHQRALAVVLDWIVRLDTEDDQRNRMIWRAIPMAHGAGLHAGVRIALAEPESPVAFIELPQGQVSWRLPQHERPWDRHTTQQKIARIRAFRNALGIVEPLSAPS